MIAVRGVEKRYGNFTALRDVSFEVGTGEIVGLLGPNGAGKTTLIRILTGYHYPSGGEATIGGRDVVRYDRHVKERIGYLPENAPLYHDMHVYEYLRFMGRVRGLTREGLEERLAMVVGQCGLQDVLFRSISSISKGYRQRVGLAQAMIHDPDILILDEPTSGLDPNQVIEIRRLIQEVGKRKTVILSTHILQEVEAMCTRVLIINEGELVAQGTTAEIAAEMKGQAHYTLTFYVEDGGAAAKRGAADKKGAADKRGAGEKQGVSAKRSASELRAALAKAPQVGKVVAFDKTRSVAGRQFYSAEVALAEQDGDIGGAVLFEWALEARAKLTSLVPSGIKLEDIFARLTR